MRLGVGRRLVSTWSRGCVSRVGMREEGGLERLDGGQIHQPRMKRPIWKPWKREWKVNCRRVKSERRVDSSPTAMFEANTMQSVLFR